MKPFPRLPCSPAVESFKAEYKSTCGKVWNRRELIKEQTVCRARHTHTACAKAVPCWQALKLSLGRSKAKAEVLKLLPLMLLRTEPSPVLRGW